MFLSHQPVTEGQKKTRVNFPFSFLHTHNSHASLFFTQTSKKALSDSDTFQTNTVTQGEQHVLGRLGVWSTPRASQRGSEGHICLPTPTWGSPPLVPMLEEKDHGESKASIRHIHESFPPSSHSFYGGHRMKASRACSTLPGPVPQMY